MIPTNAEVIFWCVLGAVLVGAVIYGLAHSDHEMEMSEEWMRSHGYRK